MNSFLFVLFGGVMLASCQGATEGQCCLASCMNSVQVCVNAEK